MFDQTIASAAVAKLIKEACPSIMTVLGGYAVQHDNGREVLKAFPQIDCICRGDGEPVISRLARASVGEEAVGAIPGVLTRSPNAESPLLNGMSAPAAKANLRDAQPPDYSDWYADLGRIEKEHGVSVDTRGLPIEASRGCWWGQKQHCTFCGIDEDTLKYRSKSAEQVVAEIETLRKNYPDNYLFRFSDYIFPHHFHETLLPHLNAFEPRVWLEAEIKANQTENKLRDFAEAGFRALQPGIESFSSQALAGMNKGVRGIHNVQLLKWGYLSKIVLHYNLLYGFPDDTVEDYRRLVESVPRLYHLMPPISRTEVIITRFAPLQADPARFGIQQRPVHHECYDVLFSTEFLQSTGFDLDNYCYYFKRHFQYGPGLYELYGQLVLQVNHWKEQHKVRDVYLSYRRDNGTYHFEDTRFGEPEERRLSGLLSAVYNECDSAAVPEPALAQRLGLTTPDQRAELSNAVQELDSMRLIWREDDTIFGLGTPADSTHSVLDRPWRACWGGLYE
jgi:ribosomal peptide maturation radical SAM protein 1